MMDELKEILKDTYSKYKIEKRDIILHTKKEPKLRIVYLIYTEEKILFITDKKYLEFFSKSKGIYILLYFDTQKKAEDYIMKLNKIENGI